MPSVTIGLGLGKLGLQAGYQFLSARIVTRVNRRGGRARTDAHVSGPIVHARPGFRPSDRIRIERDHPDTGNFASGNGAAGDAFAKGLRRDPKHNGCRAKLNFSWGGRV